MAIFPVRQTNAAGAYIPQLTFDLTAGFVQGNTLVALIAVNSQGASGAADCGISTVTDNAHNVWVEAATVFQAGPGASPETAGRLSIWYTTNAARAQATEPRLKVTVTCTQIVDSMAATVIEVAGVTNVNPLDFTNTGGGSAMTTITASGISVTSNVLCFAAAATGSKNPAVAHVADSWSPILDTFSTGEFTPGDGTKLAGAWKFRTTAGSDSTQWTRTPSGQVMWAVIGLKEGPTVTSNPNLNWPQVQHQVAFGSKPNDPNADVTWTNITDRVTGFNVGRGRNYELARIEAGTAEVNVRNEDAAFSPMNASSPYYPNVNVITPYRVRAVWNGKIFPIFSGYVERWPMKWEHQRGIARLQAVDGLATLAGTLLNGAIGSEIMKDGPWAYWPLDDGRLASQAKNSAPEYSQSMIIYKTDGGGRGSFNADLNLPSEQSTCWEQVRTQAGDPDGENSNYGACLMASMPLPPISTGILFECWAKVPKYTPENRNYYLMALKSSFSPQSTRVVMALRMRSDTGQVVIDHVNSGGSAVNTAATDSGFSDDQWHHYVVHAAGTTVRLWIDGVQQINLTGTTFHTAVLERFYLGGQIDEWSTGAYYLTVGSFAHAAIYQLGAVDQRRVTARAGAGITGFPEYTGARVTRILNYANWTAGRAIDKGLAFLGPASTISKQSLLAAFQDVTSWENGVGFVDGAGNLRFIDRANRFATPERFVFGDQPGEIPFLADAEIEYDPRYVVNDVTVTRTIARLPNGERVNGDGSSHRRDNDSIDLYFTRTLSKNSGVSSVSQCVAEAEWLLENYKEPKPRLGRISITPSANPALWEVALGVEVGDRVKVKRTPFGGDPFELECYVEQVGHQVKPNEWKTLMSLSPVLDTTYTGETKWILNESILGIDTVVG